MGKATGFIEVFGLAAAFVAVDAGCKAADVTVEHFDKNKPVVQATCLFLFVLFGSSSSLFRKKILFSRRFG